jgi:hypothetical protein
MSNFDITQHEWSDKFVRLHESRTSESKVAELSFDNELYLVDFNKQDAIAIAKHFGLTKEDFE